MNFINDNNSSLTLPLEPVPINREGRRATITFLGTGTSTGVPQLGCKCPVCRSDNPKDKRLRNSALITVDDKRFLIDAGPDLRQQLITNHIFHVTGILLTHEHYDHVGGLDDVRPLGETNIYAEANVLEAIERNMSYCFGAKIYPGVPKMNLHRIDLNPFQIKGVEITPIRVMHARLPVLGFRIGEIAYLTDVKTITDAELEKLRGLKVLVINALRKEEHISHISLSEAIHIARKVNAENTYFSHISHHLGLHDEVSRELPENIHLAYDNLSINI